MLAQQGIDAWVIRPIHGPRWLPHSRQRNIELAITWTPEPSARDDLDIENPVRRQTHPDGVSRWRSTAAEPVIALVLPVAAEIFIGDGHLHHVLRILEAELGRHAYFHGEAVLVRQDLTVEL